MADTAVQPVDLPDISRALASIEEMERDARDTVCRDGFGATMSGRYYHEQMTVEDRAALRRLALRTQFRRIDLQVRRCASLGVHLAGYDDIDAWVESKLEMLPADAREAGE
jgi:hypothetical protein